MSTKDAYEQKLRAQLAEWRADYDKLMAKADQAGADVKIEFSRQRADLDAKQAAASAKLDALRAASGDAWEDLKAGVDKAFDDLTTGIKAAATRFKG